MPSEFQYKVYLPSIADYVRVSELKNREHLNIIKFNKNNDSVGLSNYLEQLIQNKIQDKNIELHRVDKYCIILTMIMLCVDGFINLRAVCEETEEEYEISVDVGDILNIISNIEYKSPEIQLDNTTIHFNYPVEIYNTNVEDATKYISTITIEGKEYDLSQLTKSQLDSVFDILPGSTFKELAEKIKQMRTSYDDIELLTFQSPYADNTKQTRLGVDLIGNDVFDFICILLGQDLNGYYEMQFAMMSNYHFPPEYYQECTPIEVKIFYSYMKQDVENQKKQLEDHKKQNQTPVERVSG